MTPPQPAMLGGPLLRVLQARVLSGVDAAALEAAINDFFRGEGSPERRLVFLELASDGLSVLVLFTE